MRKLITALLLLIAFISNAQIDIVKPAGSILGFGDYKPATIPGMKYPAVFFFCGTGELLNNIDLATGAVTHGPLSAIKNKAVTSLPAFVFAPQAANWSSAKTGMDFINWAIKMYPIDTNRIVITGLSLGGQEVNYLLDAYPNKFYAAVALSPAKGFKNSAAIASGKTKIFEWHNLDDTRCSPAYSINSVYGIWQAKGWKKVNILADKPNGTYTASLDPLTLKHTWLPGLQTVNDKASLTLSNSGGHGNWSSVYNNPAFYDWLFAVDMLPRTATVTGNAINGNSLVAGDHVLDVYDHGVKVGTVTVTVK